MQYFYCEIIFLKTDSRNKMREAKREYFSGEKRVWAVRHSWKNRSAYALVGS